MIRLIRAGALLPFVRWMQANGRPVEERLRQVDLTCLPRDNPDLPIRLGPAIAFFPPCEPGRGPGFRLPDRLAPGRRRTRDDRAVALGSSSVREALSRVGAALPCNVTHELITAVPAPGGMLLGEAWIMRMDEETRHIVKQYTLEHFHADRNLFPIPICNRM